MSVSSNGFRRLPARHGETPSISVPQTLFFHSRDRISYSGAGYRVQIFAASKGDQLRTDEIAKKCTEKLAVAHGNLCKADRGHKEIFSWSPRFPLIECERDSRKAKKRRFHGPLFVVKGSATEPRVHSPAAQTTRRQFEGVSPLTLAYQDRALRHPLRLSRSRNTR